MSKWYANWFNSPYYHILYKDRDFKEAERFVNNLFAFMKPKDFYQIIDMACGKGRHAKLIADLGFDTIGLDLSEESIDYAKKYEKCNLHFFKHNMLNSPKQYFSNADIVLNLFTSFGYFNDLETHKKAIKNFTDCIAPGGYFVFDFMNSKKVINNLVKNETKHINGIDFEINRSIKNNIIYKEIQFEDNNKEYKFREEVFALTLDNFKDIFTELGFTINYTFGDYDLNNFKEKTSSRLIIIAQK